MCFYRLLIHPVPFSANPILLCNDLGVARAAQHASTRLHNDTSAAPVIASDGQQSLSVKEAVRLAAMNNFMGLMLPAQLLVCFHFLAALVIYQK